MLNTSSKRYALIVAGGTGSRMQQELPKQFLLLNGKPILMHTLEAFAKESIDAELILVLNVDYHNHWKELQKKYTFSLSHTLVKGGNTRFESVKRGLQGIEKQAWVAVHDAVRPLVSEKTILSAFKTAEEKGNAVVAAPMFESIRKTLGEHTQALNREEYFSVQTPQVFKAEHLQKAYQQVFRNEFTDDASVMERMGHTIHLVEGNRSNIKITYPEDLMIAEALWKGYIQD